MKKNSLRFDNCSTRSDFDLLGQVRNKDEAVCSVNFYTAGSH